MLPRRPWSLTLRNRRLLVVRLAVFAVVLNAWAPSVTALVAAATGQRMALPEHCLAMALAHAREDPAKPDAPDRDKGASCPFCFAHAGSVALPPIAQAPTLPAAAPEFLAQRSSETIHSSPLWLNPRPRGPPFLT